MTTKTDRQHTPEKDELSDAIAFVLKGNAVLKNAPKAKDVHKSLLEQNPNWKITEKQVNKILKKQLKVLAQPEDNVDDDDASEGSNSSKKKSLLSLAGTSIRKIVPDREKLEQKLSFNLKNKISKLGIDKRKIPSKIIFLESAPSEVQEANLLPPIENEDDKDQQVNAIKQVEAKEQEQVEPESPVEETKLFLEKETDSTNEESTVETEPGTDTETIPVKTEVADETDSHTDTETIPVKAEVADEIDSPATEEKVRGKEDAYIDDNDRKREEPMDCFNVCIVM